MPDLAGRINVAGILPGKRDYTTTKTRQHPDSGLGQAHPLTSSGCRETSQHRHLREAFRFGGDEFIVLLPAGSALRDDGIANELIRRISLPLRVEGEQLAVTLSIGSVRYPKHGDKHDLLLRRADNALYHAKAAGKNLHLRFQTDMEETVTRRLIMLNELRQASERDQLVVCINLSSNCRADVSSAPKRWSTGIIPSMAGSRPPPSFRSPKRTV